MDCAKSKNDAGIKGTTFQLDLLSLLLLNAIRLNLENWKLSTENPEAGKFDDAVLQFEGGAILLQVKHKANKPITLDQLFSSNSKKSDFSLPKYFLSYLHIRAKFENDSEGSISKKPTVVICTNTQVKSEIFKLLNVKDISEDNVLWYQKGCQFHTFRESIIDDLLMNTKDYHKYNAKDIQVDETSITEENAKEFLRQLQFYIKYSSGNDLKTAIEKLLSNMSRSNNVLIGISYVDLHEKVKQWFGQPKCKCLTESTTTAMFCEIISGKYCEKLRGYNVFFKNTISLNIKNSEQRIFHVVAEGGRLLHLLRIYQQVQDSKEKVLYVSSDCNIDVQIEIIKAFKQPKYTLLIIASTGFSNESEISEISYILQQILDDEDREYKKVIFIAERNNEFARRLKSANNNDYNVYDESLTLGDISEDTQDMLLKKENVIIQREFASLQELLSEQIIDKYQKIGPEILEKIITGEQLTIGTKLEDTEEETLEYYVDRWMKGKRGGAVSENEFCNIDDKMILISDSAGMGKTTVLKNLAMKIKIENKRLWVVRVELIRCTYILSNCKKNKRRLTLLELLKYNDGMQAATELEKLLLFLDGTIVLMLDGIDEVSPEYTDVILDLLVQSQNEKCIKKVFLTTRPHMIEKLQQQLKVASFKLVPFTKQNQVEFLISYFTSKLGYERTNKCKRYAISLIDKVAFWIQDWYSDVEFAASPLHANILASVFFNGVKEYISTNEEEPTFPDRMNICELYEMFVKRKKDIFVKKGNSDENNISIAALQLQFDNCVAYHRSMALKTMFEENNCNLFSCYKCESDERAESTALNIGIVQKPNNTLMFIHKTFAEYFVAESIVKELQLPNVNVEFQKLFINEVLWRDEFQMVRRFLENFFYKPEPPLKTESFNDYKIRIRDSQKRPLIHKQATEGNTEIIGFVLKLIDFKMIPRRNRSFKLATINLFRKNKNTLAYLKNKTRRDGLDMKDSLGMAAIHEAVTNRHLGTLKFLVQMGADVDCIVDRYPNDSVLHIAASAGLRDIVEFLLKKGANANIKNKNGDTPIIYAIEAGFYDIVVLLVEHHANINIRNNQKNTLLHLAAKKGSMDIFQYLVGCSLNIHDVNELGETVLYLATENGNFEMIEFIVKHNVDINIPDNTGSTPLHFAVLFHNLKMIEFLVGLDADVNIVDKRGRTALHLAILTRKYNSAKVKPSQAFNRNGEIWKIVEYLVKEGAKVNIRDKEGNTALHFAVSKGFIDIVKLLLENKADIKAVNVNGNTTLHWAVQNCHSDMIKLLLKYEADTKVANKKGNTALHLAILRNDFDVVKLLLDSGVDINAANKKGNTALHLSVEAKLDITELLIKRGAQMSLLNNKWEQVVYRKQAIMNGRREVDELEEWITARLLYL